VFDGRAGAVSVPVGVVVVLFPPPIMVTGSALLLVIEAVAFDDIRLPVDADAPDEVVVANVLPSKSEGTVGLGASSEKLRSDPVRVMTDAEPGELLWPAARPVSHTRESIAAFMIVTGVECSISLAFGCYAHEAGSLVDFVVPTRATVKSVQSANNRQ